MMYRLTYFGGQYDNQAREYEEFTWDELVSHLSTHVRTDTKNSLGFIAGKFKDVAEAVPARKAKDKTGARVDGTIAREAVNIVEMYCLAVDYDGGAKINEVREQLKGLRHLGYSSYNHLKDGVTEKFRIILPFDKPCSANAWRARQRTLLPLFPGADRTTFSLGRIFFAPSTPKSENRQTVVWSEDGEDFCWEDVPCEELKTVSPRPTGTKAGTGRVLRGTLDLLSLFSNQGLNPRLQNAAEGKYLVDCPQYAYHTNQDKSGTCIWSGIPGKRDGFHCAHGHCQGVKIWDMFPTEVLEEFCEREPDGLVLIKGESIGTTEEGAEVREEIKVPQRTFSKPAGRATREAEIKEFTTKFLKTRKVHAVLRTAEGYGKSTSLVKELLKAGKNVLFCCSSNAQANEKCDGFVLHGAERVWSKSGLFEHTFGYKPPRPESTDPWELPAMDEEEAADMVQQSHGYTREEAFEAFEEFAKIAANSRQSTSRLLVTTFATGSMLFNREFGRLGRVIVVDDPSMSDLTRFKYDFDEETNLIMKVKEREVEEVVFGQEYAFQDKVIWTTTEALVTEAIKVQHEGCFVRDIQESIDTENKCLIVPTEMVRQRLKKVLPGIHHCVQDDTKSEQNFLANGVQSKLNLVSTKGRNDLQADSVIVISFPHPLDLAAVTATLEYEDHERPKVLAQLVTDICDQAVGRGQGHRDCDANTLILCDPKLEVSLRMRSRYRLVTPAGLERRGRLHGVPLVWNVHVPQWWSAWFSYLETWQQYVVIIQGHVYETLTMRKLKLSADQVKILEKRLKKPPEFSSLLWKKVSETVSGDDENSRRNFTEVLHELVEQVNRDPRSKEVKVKRKGQRVGQKWFCFENQRKRFVPGQEPVGWVEVPRKSGSGGKRR